MKSLKLNQLDSKQLNNIKGGATFMWSYKFNDKGERVGLKLWEAPAHTTTSQPMMHTT